MSFTEVAGVANLDLGGGKDGGNSWGDLNNDGCLDLAVNRNDRGRMYIQDKDGSNNCLGTFTDVTDSHLNSWDADLERSAIWGDFNNDGYLDFAHNENSRIRIYLNRGPAGSGIREEIAAANLGLDYSFGLNNDNDPNFELDNENDPNHNTFNIEGMMWVDYNLDGWLDLIADNHESGTFALQKIVPTDVATCYSTGFNEQLQSETGLSQLLGGADGDFSATADYDDDGDQDILLRKEK